MLAFVILSFIALVAALMVVTNRNPVVSAMYLALTLAATAGLFLVLGAEFLAVIQVIVYAGAIMVFFLFVVMLLNVGKLGHPEEDHPYQFWIGLFGAIAMGLTLLFVVSMSHLGEQTHPELSTASNTKALATELFTRYLAPFELSALLLLVAMVGAVVLAKRKF